MKDLIDKLIKSDLYSNQICYRKSIPAVKSKFVEIPDCVNSDVKSYLKDTLGIKKLYSHQGKSLELSNKNKNIIITTPTSSGKSLCFNLPIINEISNNPKSTALFIYPTKALAADQMQKLSDFLPLKDRIFTYDGDTSFEDRAFIRNHGNIIFTNPDMLHMGILPFNSTWSNFFFNLKYIVIDEFHTYKGAFAAHMAFLIRRLRRICEYYGSSPKFFMASATISNAKNFAKLMTGLDFEEISESGAEKGEEEILFWNPSIIPNTDQRKSTNSETVSLFLWFITRGYRSIVFSGSRLGVELMLRQAKDILTDFNDKLKNKIVSYRGGYTKESRRETEEKIFSNKILGIISTNALELGVDIGGLDVSIVSGYPQTAASLWQQFGRSGRAGHDSCSILVAKNSPIDQYYMANPKAFFDNLEEKSIVDLENPFVTYDQMACTLADLPINPYEIFNFFGENALKSVGELMDAGLAGFSGEKFFWNGKAKPATEVNIRGTSNDTYNIILIEENHPKLLGTCDGSRVFSTLYQGAIYLHEGESYIVNKLDTEEKVSYVLPTSVDYYTVPNDNFQIDSTGTIAQSFCTDFFVKLEMVNVKIKITSYSKKKIKGDTVIEKIPLDLPETILSTQAIFFNIPQNINDKLTGKGFNIAGSIHALEHILIAIAPVIINCDRNDIGGVSFTSHQETNSLPAIFIYDGYQGGLGIVRELFSIYKSWFEKALQSLSSCKCSDGCPSCIHSPKCGNNNSPLDKQGALFLLEELLNYK